MRLLRIKVSPIVFLVLLSLVGAFAMAAKPKPPVIENPIQVVGHTADDRHYPIYDLRGDLHDLTYISSMSVVYQPDQLPVRIGFIYLEDVNRNGYACDFVCKDKLGRIVGMNPEYAGLYHIQAFHADGKPVMSYDKK